MHYVQQHILKSLVLKNRARFAEMKPKEVEGNRFVYHLNALKRLGYLAQEGLYYRLTPEGKRFSERVSLENFRERVQPKIVTMAAVRNKQGEYLLYRRRRVPLSGLVGFPYGKVHLGERLEEAAHRELLEKTGLSAALSYRGSAYIAVHDEEELVTHMLCHIYEGTHPTGEITKQTLAGDSFWAAPEKVPARDMMPGFKQLLSLLKARKPFFKEYFLDVYEA